MAVGLMSWFESVCKSNIIISCTILFLLFFSPRDYEEIINTSCKLARHLHTAQWHLVLDRHNNFHYNQNRNINTFLNGIDKSPFELSGNPNLYTLLPPRRDPRCGPYSHCGVCQGHCNKDEDCVGKLKCFERSWDNPLEVPPGCVGEGEPRTCRFVFC